jgi:hypothetical protein
MACSFYLVTQKDMKHARLQRYLQKKNKKALPLTGKKEVPVNPDQPINQDNPVFPPGQANEENIKPRSAMQKKVAGLKKKQPDTIIMDLPEVKDIPGQENIKPPRMREMMDTTISSADEEGAGLLDDINKEESDADLFDQTTNVTEAERELLSRTDRPVTEEQQDRKKLALDKKDERDPLNEEGDPGDLGKSLDVPGAELDDAEEQIGEEDEENNLYSRPD